jgi:hemoglobin
VVIDRTDLDKQVARTTHEVIVIGYELWKKDSKESSEGCFHLFQGALITLQPTLEYRPRLASLVKERLDRVKDMKPTEGAFALREALDAVFLETSPALIPPKKASLWERLGGEKAIRTLVHDFVAAAMKDPKVDLTRGGKFKLDDKATARLEEVIVELVSYAGSGPLVYTGGDIPRALTGTKITGAEYDALVRDLESALKKNKIGAAETEELLKMANAIRPDIVGR